MYELLQKEGNSIFTFTKGDIIIRLKNRIITESKTNDNLGITIEVQVGIDSSFRRPLEFMGIENNIIYLRDIKEDGYFNKKYVHKANLDDYSENWALFIIPDGLTIDDCI